VVRAVIAQTSDVEGLDVSEAFTPQTQKESQK